MATNYHVGAKSVDAVIERLMRHALTSRQPIAVGDLFIGLKEKQVAAATKAIAGIAVIELTPDGYTHVVWRIARGIVRSAHRGVVVNVDRLVRDVPVKAATAVRHAQQLDCSLWALKDEHGVLRMGGAKTTPLLTGENLMHCVDAAGSGGLSLQKLLGTDSNAMAEKIKASPRLHVMSDSHSHYPLVVKLRADRPHSRQFAKAFRAISTPGCREATAEEIYEAITPVHTAARGHRRGGVGMMTARQLLRKHKRLQMQR